MSSSNPFKHFSSSKPTMLESIMAKQKDTHAIKLLQNLYHNMTIKHQRASFQKVGFGIIFFFAESGFL
jgi:hypothetical protein